MIMNIKTSIDTIKDLLGKRDRLPTALHGGDDCEKLYNIGESIVIDQILLSNNQNRRWSSINSILPSSSTIPLKRKIDSAVDLLLDLEQINREANLQTRHTKENTANVKLSLNSAILQLQNLQYQQLYLEKEIAECEDLDTIYQDIGLISEEELKATAPPEFQNADNSRDQMVNRLKHEILLRRKLQTEEKTLIITKDQVRKQSQKKKEDLSKLDDDVGSIIKSSKLLQTKLGTAITETREKYDRAALLPLPLFALFNHAIGYACAFEDTIGVELAGKFDAAKSWHSNGYGELGPKMNQSNDHDHNVQTDDDTIKLSCEMDDESKNSLYMRHPLEVVVSIRDSSFVANAESTGLRNPYFVNLTFAYLVRLGIVVVSEELCTSTTTTTAAAAATATSLPFLTNSTCGPYALTCGIFPNDFGVESPNPANEFLTSRFVFDSNLARGRAYRWAQSLCGLEFPTNIVKANSRWYADVIGGGDDDTNVFMRPYLSKVCDFIRVRHRALKSLGLQLSNLIGYKPKPMIESPNPNHLVKINQILEYKNDDKYVGQDSIMSQDDLNVIKSLSMILETPGFTMNVAIVIHLGYPDVVPTFTFIHDGKNMMGVDADTICQHYKEIERVVCQQPKELVRKFFTTAGGSNQAMLLTYQVLKSIACADIFFSAVRAGDDETLDAALPDYATVI